MTPDPSAKPPLEGEPPVPMEATPPEPLEPSIHAAERASGPSGAILRLTAIDFAGAVARRLAGEDVVVCGDDTDANRGLAYRIETTVGSASRPQHPHRRAGPLALPHFHQVTRSPDGHTFYETAKRKARKTP